jgi:hypothetical protein
VNFLSSKETSTLRGSQSMDMVKTGESKLSQNILIRKENHLPEKLLKHRLRNITFKQKI